MRVVIAAGGTAGHVNPAIALAQELDDVEIVFLGTAAGPERDLTSRWGLPFETITVRGFDRARPLSLFPTALVALRAFVEARRVLRRLRPTVVVGMGGYVSLPVCFAARALRIPVVLHEQNIVLGLAHKVCRSFARHIAVSFEETLEQTDGRGVLVGNPVLPRLVESDPETARRSGRERWNLAESRRTVLVFGGSQGARGINQGAVELGGLWSEREDVQVLHICGVRDLAEYERRVPPTPSRLIYRLVGFVDDMAEAYGVADIAVCRGGATTVAELTVARLPSVIVPYPHHRDRQQERHGRVLERAGAARVVSDDEATGARLAREIDDVLASPQLLQEMADAAAGLGRPDAARRLADLVLEAAA
ncbi:MAG: undecaprenyldiphospho-muramoylpentapeptide beta-N-acetylglucosaminyltransferase [Actinomycetota bacterium]